MYTKYEVQRFHGDSFSIAVGTLPHNWFCLIGKPLDNIWIITQQRRDILSHFLVVFIQPVNLSMTSIQ